MFICKADENLDHLCIEWLFMLFNFVFWGFAIVSAFM